MNEGNMKSQVLILFLAEGILLSVADTTHGSEYRNTYEMNARNLDDMYNFDKRLKSMRASETGIPHLNKRDDWEPNLHDHKSLEDCSDDLTRCSENYKFLLHEKQQYVIKFVRLFLSSLELQGKKKMLDSFTSVDVDLTFSIKVSDLEFLHHLSIGQGMKEMEGELRRLESIISTGIKLKRKGYFSEEFDFKSFSFNFHILRSEYFYYVMFTISCYITFLLVRYYGYKTLLMCAFIICSNWILMESVFEYKEELQAAENKRYAMMLKIQNSKECDPSKWSVWGMVHKWFFEDPCAKLREEVQKKDLLEFIVKNYGKYFVQLPCEVMETAVSQFAGKINAYFPGFLQQFTYPFMLIIAFVLVLCTVFSIFGRNLTFNCFGIGLNISPTREHINRGDEKQQITAPVQNFYVTMPFPRVAREAAKNFLRFNREAKDDGNSAILEDKKDIENISETECPPRGNGENSQDTDNEGEVAGEVFEAGDEFKKEVGSLGQSIVESIGETQKLMTRRKSSS